MGGPLSGVRVVELAGMGPSTFAGMLLSDMGADVVRVDRAPAAGVEERRRQTLDVVRRGRRSIVVDLKHPGGPEVVLRLADQADALLEGYRPGVAERLGIGPDACLARNPRLVYARVTGWGQDGPLRDAPGHDIDYIAVAGALEPLGRRGDAPVPPLNLVGDNGGGGMLAAFGVVCGILQARESGVGQVLDASILDGAALLTANFHGFRAMGGWDPERGANLCTGAPFYDTYETADGRYVAVGAQEPKLYADLLRRLGLDDEDVADQMDRSRWPALKARVAAVIATRTRDEWCADAEGTDACISPVLAFDEVADHPHNAARGTFVRHDGVVQPAPAPRFSRTAGAIARRPPFAGEHTGEVLREWGFSTTEIERLRDAGAIELGGDQE